MQTIIRLLPMNETKVPPDEIKIKSIKYFEVSIDYPLGVTDSPNPYAEERNYIRLPAKFPTQTLGDLRDYIHYLLQK